MLKDSISVPMPENEIWAQNYCALDTLWSKSVAMSSYIQVQVDEEQSIALHVPKYEQNQIFSFTLCDPRVSNSAW